MDAARRTIAAEVLAASRAHDAAHEDRLARYRNLEPELRMLAPGGLLAIDNVLSHAEQVEEVTALIEAEPSVTTTPVPIGAGVRWVVRDQRRA